MKSYNIFCLTEKFQQLYFLGFVAFQSVYFKITSNHSKWRKSCVCSYTIQFHSSLYLSNYSQLYRGRYQGLVLITRAIWKRPWINLFITYFARADNMLLPFTRGQITCYCPHKMLLPRRQITRHKLCFYYTCKFGVISIKYVIIWYY